MEEKNNDEPEIFRPRLHRNQATIEHINDGFYITRFGVACDYSFQIMVRKNDGKINISKFITKYGDKAKFSFWERNDKNKKFVAVLPPSSSFVFF